MHSVSPSAFHAGPTSLFSRVCGDAGVRPAKLKPGTRCLTSSRSSTAACRPSFPRCCTSAGVLGYSRGQDVSTRTTLEYWNI